MPDLVLDSHVHCGYTVPFEELSEEWRHGSVHGGAVFSPVEEIYDRYDPLFVDSADYERSRERVHRYLLDVGTTPLVYPYFFVWNDFPAIPDGFVGVKWHRHPGEPVYRYDAPGCERIIEEITAKALPIILEEEFPHTRDFISRIAGRTVIIIPHMGGLNGGYSLLKREGVFDNPLVWADTALAHPSVIEDFARSYGVDRLLFGSDYPFGSPAAERRKVERIFSGDERAAVLSGNLLRLLGRGERE